ncbi:alanine dehydrogenase [Pontibacter ummariensis]|uniref:Saccharopine dehydrogenase [NAD(+), L-lysine-forming] n=1 Tax=Pontibacter ummariensis TaxID=1610492 RepID=A0A239CYJ4_9BACT|nr:NAD(P)-dependent oxidoreductase [Pontibacter ummariensis]PRY14764.1 alanine dehydrogenase [Pontibacter ummariensis]SNS24942.1 Alanine dehydrogenase [Pontibacter ummariensis]
MSKLRVGIIKEGKVPVDKRVPLTPKKCVEALQKFPEMEIAVQPSDVRCFTDEEYEELGITLQQDLTSCDVLMGVKEVPFEQLIPDKTYLFFSHTIKKQPHNAKLLRAILDKNITLIDYETLKTAEGQRVVAFGRYAGIVGAYNGILTYGKKHGLFNLKPAYLCHEMEDMQEEYFKVKLPPIKIAVTGGGRVAGGAMEVLDKMGIKKVSVFDYLYKQFSEPVYAQLHTGDYNARPDVEVWDSPDFYANPHLYKSTFRKFTRVTDILLACAYWDPKAPRLFTEEETRYSDFRINTIADITCDVNGSIPCTKRATTIPDPVYDYNKETGELEPPFTSPDNITVMAVDNLPCELPRNASRDFGRLLIDNVFPHFFNGDKDGVLERGTIAKGGKLTERYSYLQGYADSATANRKEELA